MSLKVQDVDSLLLTNSTTKCYVMSQLKDRTKF